MSTATPSGVQVGYSRSEFGKIFQIYSHNVYLGMFRDFSFFEEGGRYFISFWEEAGKSPLITVEKRRLGPDKSLFIATTPGVAGQPVEIVRSEKIDHFTERLKASVEDMRTQHPQHKPVKSLRIVP